MTFGVTQVVQVVKSFKATTLRFAFSHALIAALKLIVSGHILVAIIKFKRVRACNHRTCVRTYVTTYVRTYVCAYVRSHGRTYVCTYVRTYVCTYVRTDGQTGGRTDEQTDVRMYVRTY